jgi:hypothetical protein
MTKYKYNYKYRTLCIPLFDDDGKILYDCLYVYNNLDVGSLQIYDKLRHHGNYITSFHIGYNFADTRCEKTVRNRMIELMQKNPNISLSEIVKIIGHSKPTIDRHYMILKRGYVGNFALSDAFELENKKKNYGK